MNLPAVIRDGRKLVFFGGELSVTPIILCRGEYLKPRLNQWQSILLFSIIQRKCPQECKGIGAVRPDLFCRILLTYSPR